MDNKDVEGAIDWVVNILSKIADGISALLNMTPDVVIGAIAALLIVIWAWKKVSN